MSLPLIFGFCALLVAFIGLFSRAAIEGDVLDSLLLCSVCVAIGYLLPKVFI